MSWRSKARWASPLSSHRRLVERELTIGRPDSTRSSSTQAIWAAQARNRGRQTSKSVRSRPRSWSRSWTSVTSKPSALRRRASTGFHEFTSAASQHRSTRVVSRALISSLDWVERDLAATDDEVPRQRDLMRGALEDVHLVAGRVDEQDHVADRDPVREPKPSPGDQLALDAVGADQVALDRFGRLAGGVRADQERVDEEVVRGRATLGAVHRQADQPGAVGSLFSELDPRRRRPAAVESASPRLAVQPQPALGERRGDAVGAGIRERSREHLLDPGAADR